MRSTGSADETYCRWPWMRPRRDCSTMQVLWQRGGSLLVPCDVKEGGWRPVRADDGVDDAGGSGLVLVPEVALASGSEIPSETAAQTESQTGIRLFLPVRARRVAKILPPPQRRRPYQHSCWLFARWPLAEAWLFECRCRCCALFLMEFLRGHSPVAEQESVSYLSVMLMLMILICGASSVGHVRSLHTQTSFEISHCRITRSDILLWAMLR